MLVSGSTIALALVQLGCVYALKPGGLERGRPFDPNAVASVRKGMEAGEVLELLGQPLAQRSNDNGAFWHDYVVQRVRGCAVYGLGLIKLRDQPAQTEEALIVFRGGHVVDVRRSGRKGRHRPGFD